MRAWASPRPILASAALAALVALGGCNRPAGTRSTDISALGVGVEVQIDNPLKDQPEAVAEGRRLFEQMNCAGCHGYDLGGGTMAPNLTDRYWRYGGTPAAIYRSIAEGRPQGMPAWSNRLPPTDIWRLVSYIQSYGGATAPADDQAGEQGDLAAVPVRPATDAGPATTPSHTLGRSVRP